MKLHSLSVSGLITMNLHSLNNEGAEGNTTMTRMVEIVDMEGGNHTVNAVSGDMFKHIQGEHLFQLATQENLPLCEGCKTFDANRICADKSFIGNAKFGKDTLDSVILDEALRHCIIDDTQGILITSEIGKTRSIARKSCIEFGWVVGRPANTRTESYFHVKFVPEGRGRGSGAGENLGQNIFHRPASSGQYAVVVAVDLFKVGRNDITLQYALDKAERKRRIIALLKSLMNAFLKPSGAQRNTQNPHVLDFQGIVTLSTNSLPAPAVSALNSNFKEEIEGIVSNLNKLEGQGVVDMKAFAGLADFSGVMAEIISQVEPYGD